MNSCNIHISSKVFEWFPLSGAVQNRPGPRMKDSGMGGFNKMRGGEGGMPQPPSAGPSGPRSSAGPSGPRPTSAAAAAADVMVKEEPEDEDEAAGEEEYLPDDEYLEYGEC